MLHVSDEMITSHLFVANLAQYLFVVSHSMWCDQFRGSDKTGEGSRMLFLYSGLMRPWCPHRYEGPCSSRLNMVKLEKILKLRPKK